MKKIFVILSLFIISVNSIPLQYPVLNSVLKCTDYTCDVCEDFFEDIIDDLIQCAQSYITDTNSPGYLGFTPKSEYIESEDYDCASFKVKENSKGEFEDDETKIIYTPDKLTMIIKDDINNTDCKCTFNYSMSEDKEQ